MMTHSALNAPEQYSGRQPSAARLGLLRPRLLGKGGGQAALRIEWWLVRNAMVRT